ncbi:hypothetical protein D1O30_20065 [Methylocystis hirsuta]|uniref:Uncharacterized protein n=1 Tax=Methylocystis hirsuta TaxID=369798 RepID=A0A3M9XJH6_9HYPH|nr:hypothetical protein D1O30_20065 [Methylocystis hirsuta]
MARMNVTRSDWFAAMRSFDAFGQLTRAFVMARVESSPSYQLLQPLVFVAGLLLPSVVGARPPHYAIRGNSEPI